MPINLKDAIQPLPRLRKPRAHKDWDKIVNTAERLIDEAPEDVPVDVSVICRHIAGYFRLVVTPTMIRNHFFGADDTQRCLRTFLSQTEIERIMYEVIERVQNGERGAMAEKYCDLYKGQENKEEFDDCMHNLVLIAYISAREAEPGTKILPNLP